RTRSPVWRETMDEYRERAYRSWVKFLDPASLRANLIAASIFLAAYETLRNSVIERIRDFFADGFDVNGPLLGARYRNTVLALDKSPLKASLLWLKSMGVVDDADMTRIDAIRAHRNELAHDLPKYIGTCDADIDIQLL